MKKITNAARLFFIIINGACILPVHIIGQPIQQTTQFACSQCNIVFTKKCNLQRHIKECHLGNKPYRCRICAKTFARRNYYNDHMRRHAGEECCRCDVCGCSMYDRSTLRKHLKTKKHREKEEKLKTVSVLMKLRSATKFDEISVRPNNDPMTATLPLVQCSVPGEVSIGYAPDAFQQPVVLSQSFLVLCPYGYFLCRPLEVS